LSINFSDSTPVAPSDRTNVQWQGDGSGNVSANIPRPLTFQGAYSAGTTYALNDIATYSGSAYVSLQNSNLNQQPDSSPTYWEVLAQKGSSGGSLALTTKGDILGYDTTSNRVPIGTNGQVLTADSAQALGLKWDSPTAGTVTHTSGALTTDLPVLGNGSGDIKAGTKTGTGDVVFSTSPTLVTPALGTPSAAVLTNATGLPLSTGVTGTLPVGSGGTGLVSPAIVAGTGISVSGSWPNQTITSTVSGGMANPMTTQGDVIYGGSSGAATRLGAGASGYVLVSNGASSAPSWQAVSGVSSSAITPFGSLAPSLPPAAASLTWVNQSTATATDTNGLTLLKTGTGSIDQNMLVKTMPATPYTFTIGQVMYASGGVAIAGIVVRDSGTGKFVSLTAGYSGSWGWNFSKWDSPTTFNSNYANGTASFPPPFAPTFLRFNDNGTNFTVSISMDGTNFIQVGSSVSRTNFLASPNQIGIVTDVRNTDVGRQFIFYWNGI
jgi:hypothetical protein